VSAVGAGRRCGCCCRRRRPGSRGFTSGALAFLDELLDLLPTLAADLLVEVGTPLRLDPLATLAADLLVERPSTLRFHGRAALAADGLVELAAALVAHGLAALSTRLGHRHASLVVLVRHCFCVSLRGHTDQPS